MVKSGDYCNSSAGLYTTLFLEAGIDVVIYSSTMDPLYCHHCTVLPSPTPCSLQPHCSAISCIVLPCRPLYCHPPDRTAITPCRLGPPTTEAGVRAAWDSAEKAYPVLGAAAKQQYYKQRKSIWAVSSKDYDTYIGPAG